MFIHPRASVKLVLMSFSTSCSDEFRGVACTWCSLCELDRIFRIGHRMFYCRQGNKGPANGRRKKEALSSKIQITMAGHFELIDKGL